MSDSLALRLLSDQILDIDEDFDLNDYIPKSWWLKWSRLKNMRIGQRFETININQAFDIQQETRTRISKGCINVFCQYGDYAVTGSGSDRHILVYYGMKLESLLRKILAKLQKKKKVS